MIRYRLNVRFLVVTLVGVVLLGVSTSFLHAWQMQRHARGQLERADRAEAAGQIKAATAALGRSNAFAPSNPTVRARHALLLADQAQTLRERQQALLSLIAVLPSSGDQAAIRMRAVDLALSVNSPADAVKLLQPAIEAEPDRVDLRESMARALEAAGKFPAAAESLEKALELQPSHVACAESLARLYRTKLDQPRRAAGVLERLVKRNPRLPAAYVARGRDRMNAGQLTLADADLAKARKMAEDANVLAASGELARRRGQFEEAVRFWAKAAVMQPESPASAAGLARARRDQGANAAALEVATQGLTKNPDDVELTFLVADLLIDKGDLNEAVKRTNALPVTARGPKFYLQGRLELARRQSALAVHALIQANKEPDLPAGLAAVALVRVYGELGYHREQLQTAREAVQVTDNPRCTVEMSCVLVNAGCGKEALKQLQVLAALPSPPEGTWSALARVLIEQNLERAPALRKWDEVERVLAKADLVKADEPTAAILRSDVLTVRGRPAEALRTLETARAKRPHEPALWQAQAAMLARQGDFAAAQKLLAEADKRFADRLDWLTIRSVRLVNERGSKAVDALEVLERASNNLTAEDRRQLARTLAGLHARIENYPAVDRLCSQALLTDPNDLRAALMLFDAKMSQRDVAGAEKTLAVVRQIEGSDGVAWRVGQATLLMHHNSNAQARAEARGLLQQAIVARPQWSHPLLLLAFLNEMDQKPAEALASYQRMIALGDFHPRAVQRATWLLLAQERDTEADRLLEQAAGAGALNTEYLRPAAEIALRVGRHDRAVQLALQATSARNPSHRDLLWLGHVLATAGRTVGAQSAFQEAIQKAPEVADVWLGLIRHYASNAQTAEAEETIERMNQSVPKDLLPLAQARASEILGRRDEAERSYRQYLAKKPRDPKALRRLADLYLRQNAPQKAEDLLVALLDSRVLIPEEELPEIRRRLALVISTPGGKEPRHEQALALLALNRSTEGDSEADRRVAALVKGTRAADRAESLRVLEALGSGPATTSLERLRLAQLYEAQGRWTDARGQFAALLIADKENPAYLALLIEGLLRKGKKAEAARWLEKLEKLEPTAPRTKTLREQVRKAEKAED